MLCRYCILRWAGKRERERESADCPGFMVSGVASAQSRELHPGASDCVPELGFAKKPLTSVSKRVPAVHGKRGLERGWQKRLAKGWRKVGEGLATGKLAKGWRRVSGFSCTLQFRNSRGARLETWVCDSMGFASWLLHANSWICYPQLPDHPCKNGMHCTSFCNTSTSISCKSGNCCFINLPGNHLILLPVCG